MPRFAVTYEKGPVRWTVIVTAADDKAARKNADAERDKLAAAPGGTAFTKITRVETAEEHAARGT